MLVNLKNWKLIEFMYKELWRNFDNESVWVLKDLDRKIVQILKECKKNEENEQNTVKSA